MMKKSLLKLSVMVLGAAAGSVWAAGSQADYDPLKEPSGAAFAHTCAACHGTYGYARDSAFPPLAGMDAQVFASEMKKFRSKERPSSIMSHIADGYSDAAIERMAQFFAALPKTAPQGGTKK